jgi:hypothetical protein
MQDNQFSGELPASNDWRSLHVLLLQVGGLPGAACTAQAQLQHSQYACVTALAPIAAPCTAMVTIAISQRQQYGVPPGSTCLFTTPTQHLHRLLSLVTCGTALFQPALTGMMASQCASHLLPQNNNFSGTLPEALLQAQQLVMLDVSNNPLVNVRAAGPAALWPQLLGGQAGATACRVCPC